MTVDVHFSSKSSEWQTPPKLFEILNKEFSFVLDAAATKDNALCPVFFTKDDNSLVQDWAQHKSVWLNPPYGREGAKFVKKAYEESQKGCTVVCLVPARVDTKWWHSYCAKGECRFIKGRVKFLEDGEEKDGAPFPSAIVIFSPNHQPLTRYITL